MASVAGEIPIEYMIATRKMAVIEWIQGRHLPSRIARGVLQAWGEAVGVELNSTDYELVGEVGHT